MHDARDVLAAALPILHADLDGLNATALHHLHGPLRRSASNPSADSLEVSGSVSRWEGSAQQEE